MSLWGNVQESKIRDGYEPPFVRPLYYDPQGRPISLELFSQLLHGRSDDNWWKVDETDVSPDVKVSTVWLGIDHAMPGQVPMIFETMVFGGSHDQLIQRYATWKDAARGHREIVTQLDPDL